MIAADDSDSLSFVNLSGLIEPEGRADFEQLRANCPVGFVVRDRFEQAFVLRTLERENWNQSRAARSLGVHRNTLLARLQAWGFQREEPGPAPVKGRATGTGSS